MIENRLHGLGIAPFAGGQRGISLKLRIRCAQCDISIPGLRSGVAIGGRGGHVGQHDSGVVDQLVEGLRQSRLGVNQSPAGPQIVGS